MRELPVVTRTFTEGDYYCASGVAIQADVPMKKRKTYTETDQAFILEPKSKIRILVSSAGTMDPKPISSPTQLRRLQQRRRNLRRHWKKLTAVGGRVFGDVPSFISPATTAQPNSWSS